MTSQIDMTVPLPTFGDAQAVWTSADDVTNQWQGLTRHDAAGALRQSALARGKLASVLAPRDRNHRSDSLLIGRATTPKHVEVGESND